MNEISIETNVTAFHAALVRGMESLQEAGDILVALIDRDPKAKDQILSTYPEITEDILATFERIGRKQLYYKLCIAETPGVRALRRCPYSEQKKFSEQPVPMLVVNNGNPDELAVSVNTMSREQAKQVFSPARVRTLAEQRTWLQANAPTPRTASIPKPYTIHGGKVTFRESVTLTFADLARLLADVA